MRPTGCWRKSRWQETTAGRRRKRRLRACEVAGVEPTYRLLRGDIDPRAYVWAKNAERRDLSPSQRALAFALLYPKLGPGRPPGPGENCQIFDSFPRPTQGQGAEKLKVSRPLVNDAYKVADPNSWVAPEVREAVRDGIVTVSDAVRDTVSNVSQDVQREALSLVKDGSSRTLSAAVAKVERERHHEPLIIKLDRPTRLGKNLVLHSCSIDRLKWGLKPGTVDLVLAHLPEYFRLGLFYKMAELADHVLSDAGVLVVVWDGGPLREMLDRLSRSARGMKFIADFSAIFPAPITELGFPHHTQNSAGGPARVREPGSEVARRRRRHRGPRPSRWHGGRFYGSQRLPATGRRQVRLPGADSLYPILTDNCGAVVAALAAGCTVIGADEEQSVIDDVVRRVSEPTDDSSPDGPGKPVSRCGPGKGRAPVLPAGARMPPGCRGPMNMCQPRRRNHPASLSLSSDSVSRNRRQKCQSERLVISLDNGLEPWLCRRLVGWVRPRTYWRTVLRQTPNRRRSPAGRDPGPDESADLAAVQPGQADQFIPGGSGPPLFPGPSPWCAPTPGSPRPLAGWSPRAHPARGPICSRKGYAQTFRRPSGRLPPPLPTRWAGGRRRTPGGPPGEAAPSIRGADPVLAGTALRTHGPKRGPTVFHGHALDVPRRSLRPALQAVDFCSVRRCRRRCGHGQLLHRLASIHLWPARLRRSRTLCRSIVALKAQVARQGGDIPRRSRVPFPCGVGTTRPS